MLISYLVIKWIRYNSLRRVEGGEKTKKKIMQGRITEKKKILQRSEGKKSYARPRYKYRKKMF